MMEAQIKEEANEESLCFESPSETLAQLSLVEKYDQFLQTESSDVDSDGDFFPDDTMLKKEYAQLRHDTANFARSSFGNNRLSTGLPGRHKILDVSLSMNDGENRNGTGDETLCAGDSGSDRSGLTGLNALIEKLSLVRKCKADGNSIFCTENELELIQERYGEILDYIQERSSSFEQPDQQDVPEQNSELLAEKIESVRQARDRFYEVEQQVREQLDQLELVERYKMESVG